jgi:glucose/arabinose dehydrogenase
MTVPCRGFTVALLAAVVVAAAAACSGSPGQGQRTAAPSSPASGSTEAPVASAVPAPAGSTTTPLVVPAGEGGGALSTTHRLTVPAGWTARVWARVPDARMEAWTPEGDLLVSEPSDGKIMELRPDAAGTAAVTTLLAGLTEPQGMAFARLGGNWVLYVAESDQIDRYPWGSGAISDARTVIAAGLPDLDPNGDDVHRAKDVTVAANGTVYFNVGSSSNANPDDRAMSPQRAVIMAVNPDGADLRMVERGVRNGEGLAVAPDGTVWTAVNERDNIPYPSHGPYGTYSDAFGQVIQAYVNNHPPTRWYRLRRAGAWAGRTATPTRTIVSQRGRSPTFRWSPTRPPTRAGTSWTAQRWRRSRSGFPRTAPRWACPSSRAARSSRRGRAAR